MRQRILRKNAQTNLHNPPRSGKPKWNKKWYLNEKSDELGDRVRLSGIFEKLSGNCIHSRAIRTFAVRIRPNEKTSKKLFVRG